MLQHCMSISLEKIFVFGIRPPPRIGLMVVHVTMGEQENKLSHILSMMMVVETRQRVTDVLNAMMTKHCEDETILKQV